MKRYINFFYLLSIIITLFSKIVLSSSKFDPSKFDISNFDTSDFDIPSKHAKKIEIKNLNDEPKGDDYYLVFVNHTLITPPEQKNHGKRHEEIEIERKEFINSLIDEIHNLIVGNVNTYENQDTVKEIIKKDEEKLRKRKENEDIDLNSVFYISSVDDLSLVSAFLSDDLKESVKDMTGVYACLPNYKFEFARNYYNKEEILKETQWEDVSIRKNADNHLSQISQGLVNEHLIGKYDHNYYYPSKGGKDVDIFIFDTGFIFDHHEYSNWRTRTAKCVAHIDINGKLLETPTDKYCVDTSYYESYEINHGSVVADIAGGRKHGVAPNANIYGIAFQMDPSFGSLIAGLKYLEENLLGENKAVVNFSFGTYLFEFNEAAVYLEKVINELSKKGVIFVACAHNQSKNVNFITYHAKMVPCTFENVICVGATNTYGNNENDYNPDIEPLDNQNDIIVDDSISENGFNPYDNTSLYHINDEKSYYHYLPNEYQIASFSNYGTGVDIYAPGYVNSEIKSYNMTDISIKWCGTSFSTPIVTGVIANILSENPNSDIDVTSMKNYLIYQGAKNLIKSIPLNHISNVFVNNGKHIVYSEDEIYHGCGITSGFKKCKGKNECCSFDGYCTTEDIYCYITNGCQSGFGKCLYN